VLLLFFAVVVLDMAPAAVAGFNAGWNAGIDASKDSPAEIHRGIHTAGVTIQPTDPEASTQTFEGGTTFRPFMSAGMLLVPARQGGEMGIWGQIVKILFSLIAMAAMLSFLIHIVLFAVGFPRRHVMDRRNIVSLRWIAGSLGALALSVYASMLVDYLWLRSHVALEGYRVTISSPSSPLMVALILVVLTEILNLAGRLQREQDLTI
jgi:hypothetical protein